MSERESSQERRSTVSYLEIDTGTRSDVEIEQLLEKHINRDDLVRYEKVKVNDKGEIIFDSEGKPKTEIVPRDRDERTAYIIQSTLIALEITVDTPWLFEDDEQRWKLDPMKREIAKHALEVEKKVKAAKQLLIEAEHRFNRREFGDFMWDILEDVEREKSKTDLYRAFQLLRDKQIDRSDLVPAHRIALVMLHDTIDKD